MAEQVPEMLMWLLLSRCLQIDGQGCTRIPRKLVKAQGDFHELIFRVRGFPKDVPSGTSPVLISIENEKHFGFLFNCLTKHNTQEEYLMPKMLIQNIHLNLLFYEIASYFGK